MNIIGLTGSIGSGKSFVADYARRRGIAVFDADKTVHGLLQKSGAAYALVAKAFPEACVKGVLQRAKLADAIYKDPAKKKQLEAIVHPLVRSEMRRFIQRARRQRKPAVILEIPLLYEGGLQKYCDCVIVTHSPLRIRLKRVQRRSGTDEARFYAIDNTQMKQPQKRRLADYTINTGLDKRAVIRQIGAILEEIGI